MNETKVGSARKRPIRRGGATGDGISGGVQHLRGVGKGGLRRGEVENELERCSAAGK